MRPKSWLLCEHLAACSCLVITTNLSEYHLRAYDLISHIFSLSLSVTYSCAKIIHGRKKERNYTPTRTATKRDARNKNHLKKRPYKN
jgi:hypothetical protein